jgi:hypothetical protein
LKDYDEPEILPSSTRPICLIGADGGHIKLGRRKQRRTFISEQLRGNLAPYDSLSPLRNSVGF